MNKTATKKATDQNESLWMTGPKMPKVPALQEDQSADVCIVGAGIAGLTTAYLLGVRGQSVVVVDDGPLAGGETQYTTAHLANAIDDRYVNIERLHGTEGARLAAHSHTTAIDTIERIVNEEEIVCDFERLDGFLFVPPGESPDLLKHEMEAAKRAGLAEVELLAESPLPFYDLGPCLRFPSQGQFHPLKYLAGLTKAIQKQGGRIFTEAHVNEVEGGTKARVKTSQGKTVTADAVVVATNTPINDVVAIHTKQAPYTTYVIAAPVPDGSVPKGLYWDTLDPYHYVRLQAIPSKGAAKNGAKGKKAKEMLIVGGEDHKSGQANDHEARFERLEQWARDRFPMMESVELRWSGQVMETIDGLAFIGRNPGDAENVYVATGDSGMGMTHGTIAGLLLTDLIIGHRNRWASLYDPSRRTLRAAGEFLKENLNVLKQYGEWLTGGDVKSVDEIAPDSGAVIRRGLSKVAVYRDEKGKLHEHSAVCTHLGCIVDWNDAARTWDCPCHGSRFKAMDGSVLTGPANAGLEKKEK